MVSPDFILEFNNVSKSFKKLDNDNLSFTLDKVSFQLNKGDILGIIGNNGSGKSVLLKLIAGILKPTDGNIILNGSLYAILDLGMGFHPDLTGRENINLIAALNNLDEEAANELFEKALEFSEIKNYIDKPLKNYSQGMYLRLAFSIYIHLNSDIIIIDEILSVGDYAFRKKSEKAIVELAKKGKTLIIVSHDNNQIINLCNKCILLEKGKIKLSGTPNNVLSFYLNKNATYNNDLLKIDFENESIKINRFLLNSYQFKEIMEVEIDEEFCFEFIFHKINLNESIVFHLDFYNEIGQLILNTSNVYGIKQDELYNYQRDLNGDVKLTINIPAFFFNFGEYILKLSISTYTNNTIENKHIYRLERGMKILVKNKNTNLFWTYSPAPIRTDFNWQVLNF